MFHSRRLIISSVRAGRSLSAVGDVVMIVGDHPGLAPFMNVPGA